MIFDNNFFSSKIYEGVNGGIDFKGKKNPKSNKNDGETDLSVFYINDVHGQLQKFGKLSEASKEFDSFVKKEDVPAVKVSAGDTFIGGDYKTNKTAAAFMNTSGIHFSAVGNHELDMSASNLAEVAKNLSTTKFLVSNASLPDNHVFKDKIYNSGIKTDTNGEKYGIIGAQTPKLEKSLKDKGVFEGMQIKGDLEKFRLLQKEADNLKKQGVNKIIMVSHSGYDEDKKTAQNVSGIDVIIGGHTHDLIRGLKEGENLQYSPDGEPVVITQAGKDGKLAGVLNLKFNSDGVITKVQNNVYKTSDYQTDSVMKTITDSINGKPVVLTKVVEDEPAPEKFTISENGTADTFLDIIKKETDSDIALIQSGNFRHTPHKGDLTDKDIKSILPFTDKLYKVKISEKDLVDALKHGGTTLVSPDLKPSIMQVSGIEYTLAKDGKLLKASVKKPSGEVLELNIDNPSSDRMFTAAYDDFLMNGGDGFVSLKAKPENIIEKYGYDKATLLINHFKNNPDEELDLTKDNRITIQK